MAINVTPIPKLTEFGTPALTLATSNAAGSGGVKTTIRTDASVALFSTSVPVAIGEANATGSSAFATRLDHVHSVVGSMPLVFAYNSAGDTDVTGDGTHVTVDFDTEIVDQGGDFAADTFTAPVDGTYYVSFQLGLGGLTSAMTNGQLFLKSSNRNYFFRAGNAGAMRASDNEFGYNFSTNVDMDASDTLYITAMISGGAKVVDIVGSSTIHTSISIIAAG
jgi:hypothetical protein